MAKTRVDEIVDQRHDWSHDVKESAGTYDACSMHGGVDGTRSRQRRDAMTMTYERELGPYSAGDLKGFFEGWPDPPDSETHIEILRNSDAFVLAVDTDARRPVGFVTAVTDGVLAAYIPLLEVLSDWRGQGIGSRLVEEVCDDLEHLYMIDAICDESVVEFYEHLGFERQAGMIRRNYQNQSGRGTSSES